MAEARVARCIAALREVSELLGGKSPSIEEFRRLRNENYEVGWPSDGSIRRHLGGDWNTALTKARLDAVPEHLAVATRNSPLYTSEEAITALKQCAEELGKVPNEHEYVLWARRDDVRRRPGRRPLSYNVLKRLFGGYAGALQAADLDPGKLRRERGPQGYGGGFTYSEEAIFAALEEATNLHGTGELPNSNEYARLRKEILAGEVEAGALQRRIPSYNLITSHFGSWKKTREAFEAHRESKEASDG